MTSTPPRVHPDRTAGGHRHHRRADRPAPARRPGGPRGRPPHPVHQQPQAARPGRPQLREHAPRLSAGPDQDELPDDAPVPRLLALRQHAPVPRAAAALRPLELRRPAVQRRRDDRQHGRHPQFAPLPLGPHPAESGGEREPLVCHRQLRRQRRLAVAPADEPHLRRGVPRDRARRPRPLAGRTRRHHRRPLEHALLRRAEPPRPELRHVLPRPVGRRNRCGSGAGGPPRAGTSACRT